MKKIKEWWNKPITWGGYMKFAGWSTLVSLILTIISWLIIFPPKIGKKKSEFEELSNDLEELLNEEEERVEEES